MKDESKMSLNELDKLEKVNLEVDKNATNVNEGICPDCNEKMIKYIDNENLYDGTLTFHIIKFRCTKCKKEYLDLEEAKKYDLFLKLQRTSPEKFLALV